MYDKIKKGDILVSDTTTPEMTMIMKKASAIVTDLGGVTCHAAIVCRELKIPAIVGVTNATELLKTGDTLSVDADKGEIKIL
jgi:pyruvate,water dikinase